MKAKSLTPLLAVLIVSIFALSACSKSGNTNNGNNSNNTSNSTANKGTPNSPPVGDYSTPTAAFKSFYEASKANDLEGIKRSMSKKAMEEVAKNSAKENKTVDDSLKDMTKDAPAGMPQMRNEKIEGDKASAEMKDDKMDKWITVYFVKEDGKWKVALDEEKAGGMENMDHDNMDKK